MQAIDDLGKLKLKPLNSPTKQTMKFGRIVNRLWRPGKAVKSFILVRSSPTIETVNKAINNFIYSTGGKAGDWPIAHILKAMPRFYVATQRKEGNQKSERKDAKLSNRKKNNGQEWGEFGSKGYQMKGNKVVTPAVEKVEERMSFWKKFLPKKLENRFA
jgi:hypothetical protein